jgi:hypothetical protein
MADRLSEIAEREKAATPEERFPWKFRAICGDAMHHTNPGSPLHLNSGAAWIVGPDVKSMHKAERDATLATHVRGDCRWLLQNTRNAIAYCDRILSANPNNAELMFLRTVKQILLGLDDGRAAGETEDK